MTGRLVDMAFTLGGKQRVTLEINGDFREIWDKLHQEPVLDVEIKKHREKRSLSANAYFHVLCNKISAETGESEDAVKRRLVVSYGALLCVLLYRGREVTRTSCAITECLIGDDTGKNQTQRK